jgi:hypothetical protein
VKLASVRTAPLPRNAAGKVNKAGLADARWQPIDQRTAAGQ